MKDYLIDSWKEYIGFFKNFKKNKKKSIFFIIIFEIALFIFSAYILVDFFKG